MLSREELNNLSPADIKNELAKSQRSLYKLRLDIVTRQSKASHVLKALKRYIAQLQTRLHSNQ